MRTFVFTLAAAAMFCHVAASAETSRWVTSDSKDAITDEMRKTAKVTNAEGFSFSVYSVGPSEIWANFSLPSTDTALLDSERLIVYRVDDYPAQTQDTNRFAEKELHLHSIDVQPKWINWSVARRGSPGLESTLRQLQSGRRLLVRFYQFTGGSRDVEFTLVGAREALAYVAGVPTTWDTAEELRSKERQKKRPLIEAAHSASIHRCETAFPSGPEQMKCITQESDCQRKYNLERVDPLSPDADALIACFDAVAK
jgi:hypothetical protein